VAGLGAEEYFIWTPALSRDALIAEIQRADVVVDQFDVGGLGGIAVEAMSLARPVLVYLNENALRVQYAQLPPVLNGASEVEIHTLLGRCRDRGWLNQLGQAARRWAIEHHHWSTCLDQFLFYYMLLTGHQVVDYGWDRRPGMESAVQGLESGNVRHAP
jgi:glycosyltransferase involved in cell wall biosynthesis